MAEIGTPGPLIAEFEKQKREALGSLGERARASRGAAAGFKAPKPQPHHEAFEAAMAVGVKLPAPIKSRVEKAAVAQDRYQRARALRQQAIDEFEENRRDRERKMVERALEVEPEDWQPIPETLDYSLLNSRLDSYARAATARQRDLLAEAADSYDKVFEALDRINRNKVQYERKPSMTLAEVDELEASKAEVRTAIVRLNGLIAQELDGLEPSERTFLLREAKDLVDARQLVREADKRRRQSNKSYKPRPMGRTEQEIEQDREHARAMARARRGGGQSLKAVDAVESAKEPAEAAK